MSHASLRVLSVLIALGVFAGCSSGPEIRVERYLLGPGLASDATAPTNGPTLRIDAVEIAPHLDGIVLIRDEARVDRLVYHQWAAPLDDLVEDGLREALRATGHFRVVIDSRSPAAGTWNLRVRLRHLEIDDRGAAPVARCEIEGSLTIDGRRTVSWSGRERSETSPGPGEGVGRLVTALNEAFEAATRDLARAVSAACQAGSPPGP